MPGDQLDRDDLIRGINAVIAKLRALGQPAGIRIVGGAALTLRYFDRRTTADVDAHLQPEQPILKAAVEVASPRSLLAMKLNASRPGRDVQDIANLLAICDIRDFDAAEDLLNDFYPGDGLPDKALRLLGPIFEQGIPAVPAPPIPPLWG
jgi:hypothetical protein